MTVSFLKSFFRPLASNIQALALIISTCKKGRIAFYINIPNLAVNRLTPNTYFAPQNFDSGCNQLLEMGNCRFVRSGAPWEAELELSVRRR